MCEWECRLHCSYNGLHLNRLRIIETTKPSGDWNENIYDFFSSSLVVCVCNGINVDFFFSKIIFERFECSERRRCSSINFWHQIFVGPCCWLPAMSIYIKRSHMQAHIEHTDDIQLVGFLLSYQDPFEYIRLFSLLLPFHISWMKCEWMDANGKRGILRGRKWMAAIEWKNARATIHSHSGDDRFICKSEGMISNQLSYNISISFPSW